jgi:hypothetical protein
MVTWKMDIAARRIIFEMMEVRLADRALWHVCDILFYRSTM